MSASNLIALECFLSISIPECHPFIQNISILYCGNVEDFLSIYFLSEILAPHAELMQTSSSFSLSRLRTFLELKREKSRFSTQLIPCSSSMVKTSSRAGCEAKSTAAIESATHTPLSAQRVVSLAFRKPSSS
jgi:hypothetical protein